MDVMRQPHLGITSAFVRPTPPAPGERPLDPVRRFLNSHRIEEGEDQLAGVEDATRWFAEQGYGEVRLDEPSLATYVSVREDIRGSLAGDSDVIARLDRRLSELVHVDAGIRGDDGTLVAGVVARTDDPAFQPLSAILLAVWRGAASGEITRLKVCADPRCRLAFYDRSRNRSRAWCTSGECGNRNRVARFRARQRSAPGAVTSPTGRTRSS